LRRGPHWMCGFTHKGGWIYARRGWIHDQDKGMKDNGDAFDVNAKV